MRIIDQFIRVGSKDQVNLSEGCRERVLGTDVTAYTMFDEARNEVLRIMEVRVLRGRHIRFMGVNHPTTISIITMTIFARTSTRNKQSHLRKYAREGAQSISHRTILTAALAKVPSKMACPSTQALSPFSAPSTNAPALGPFLRLKKAASLDTLSGNCGVSSCC